MPEMVSTALLQQAFPGAKTGPLSWEPPPPWENQADKLWPVAPASRQEVTAAGSEWELPGGGAQWRLAGPGLSLTHTNTPHKPPSVPTSI